MKKAFNINCLLIVAALLMSASSARAQKSNPPVEALIYSTMPSSAAHRPEMAFDRDPTTYFSSAYGMEDGDDFLVILSRPVRVKSIKVLTGDPDHNDLVTEGMIETSPDSIKYSKAAEFDKTGTATVNLNRKPVMSVRIRLNHGKGLSRLVIREITIDSDVALSHVEYGLQEDSSTSLKPRILLSGRKRPKSKWKHFGQIPPRFSIRMALSLQMRLT